MGPLGRPVHVGICSQASSQLPGCRVSQLSSGEALPLALLPRVCPLMFAHGGQHPAHTHSDKPQHPCPLAVSPSCITMFMLLGGKAKGVLFLFLHSLARRSLPGIQHPLPHSPDTQGEKRSIAQSAVSFHLNPCHKDPGPGAWELEWAGCLYWQSQLPCPILSVHAVV